MICTVEEAKKKWCPEVRDGSEPSLPAANRASGNWEFSLCIADNCMMWRWMRVQTSPEPNPVLGYCGLGDQP